MQNRESLCAFADAIHERAALGIAIMTYGWTYIIPLETFVQSRCGKIN